MDYLGVGVVARDGQGIVLGAASRHVFQSFSPHVGECLVVREGAWFACSLGVYC